MEKDLNEKENIFKLVQSFLKSPPLIVWGSGATIPFDIPSMWDLNEKLKKEIPQFDNSSDNLEIELGKDKYRDVLPEIKKIIWDEINNSDLSVLDKITSNNTEDFEGIKTLFRKFLDAHPQMLNVVTTNYDRVLEYTLSYNRINYTDGFIGKTLSNFDESLFGIKNIVNIIKVHGSLSWFNIDEEIRFLGSGTNKYEPQIIAPGRNKYREGYNSPYRELIQKADNSIKNASAFLVVGFGFNDEHLTPRIKSQVKKGIPLVLITKQITENTYSELISAQNYILFEENGEGKTKVKIKSNGTVIEDKDLIGNFWELPSFIKII